MIKRMSVVLYFLSHLNCYATLPSEDLCNLNARLSKIEGDLAYMINLVDTADDLTKQKPWIREALKDLISEISAKYASIFNVTLNNLPMALTNSTILGFRDGTKVMLGSVSFDNATEFIESNVDTDIFNPVFIDSKRSHGFIYGLAKKVEFNQVFRNETKYFIKLTLTLTSHDKPQEAVYFGIVDLNKLGVKDETTGNIYLDLTSEGGRRLSLCLDSEVHTKKFTLKEIKKGFQDLFQYKNPSAAAMLGPIIKNKHHSIDSIFTSAQLPHGLYTLSCQELMPGEYTVEICNISNTWKKSVSPVSGSIFVDSLFHLSFSEMQSFTELVFQHKETEDGTEFKKWQFAAWENIESQDMQFGRTYLRQIANTISVVESDRLCENVYRQLCNAWNCIKSMQEQKTINPSVSSKKLRKKVRSRKSKSAQTSIETTTTTDSSISL